MGGTFAARAAVLAMVAALAGCDSAEERLAEHYERGQALVEEGRSRQAGLEFRNALQINPDHAPSRRALAALLEETGDLRGALANYRAAAELDRTDLSSQIRTGQILLVGGDVAGARSFAEAAFALAPEDPEALALNAAVAAREGDAAEARRLAEAALARDPANSAAAALLVNQHMTDGDLQAAMALADRTLALAPDDLSLGVMKLRILEQGGDEAAIGAYLEELVERFPGQRAFGGALARWRDRTGDYEGAAALMRGFAEAAPEDPQPALAAAAYLQSRFGADRARAYLLGLLDGAPTEVAGRVELALVGLDQQAGDLAGARARLEGVVERHEGGAATDARLALARLDIAERDVEAARARIDAILAEDPDNGAALQLLAGLEMDQARFEDALLTLRQASAVDPDNVQTMLLTATAYERLGSDDLAGERLAAASRASDYGAEVVLRYVRFLVSRERTSAAVAVLEEGLARRPEDPVLLAAMAEMRLLQGDWSAAEAVAQQIERIDGGESAARRVRASALSRQGRFDESIELLEALSEDPDAADSAMTALVQAYLRNGAVEEAERFLAERRAEDPQALRPRLLQAELQLSRGDAAAAEATLREIVADRPGDMVGYNALGRLMIAQGAFDRAEAILRAGIEAGAQETPLLLLLAQVQEARGAFDPAIASYERLIELQPNSVVIVNNYASLIAEHRADDEQALRMAADAAERLRGLRVPELQDTYGWTRFLLGDVEGAIPELESAAAGRPGNALIQYHLGRALAATDRAAEARTALETALAIDPDFVKAASAREALAALPEAQPQSETGSAPEAGGPAEEAAQ